MWNDKETDVDFLNYKMVADAISSNIIDSHNTEPISIGISGKWGSGKSSIAKMIQKQIEANNDDQFLIVTFDAWLYQGYDEARTVFLQSITSQVQANASKFKAEDKKTLFGEKFKDWRKKIDLLALSKAAIPQLVKLVTGHPIGAAISFIVDNLDCFKGLAKPRKIDENCSVQQIDAIREELAELLKTTNTTLVVFIDDLDRCLPDTALQTLEAMRLLLFVPRTVFVIAADETMIKEAVKNRFPESSNKDSLASSYFDKLIQESIDVPLLGTNEVIIYLYSLILEYKLYYEKRNDNPNLIERCGFQELLGQSWKQKCTAKQLIEQTKTIVSDKNLLQELQLYAEIFEHIAASLIESPEISGNPRQLKRFLHSFTLILRMAKERNIEIGFETQLYLTTLARCNHELFQKINKACLASETGQIVPKVFINENLDDSLREKNANFVEIIKKLENVDLRPYFFISNVGSIYHVIDDELTAAGKELLETLLEKEDKILSSTITQAIHDLPISDKIGIAKSLIQDARKKNFEVTYVQSLSHLAKGNLQIKEFIIPYLLDVPKGSIYPKWAPCLEGDEAYQTVIQKWSKLNPIFADAIKQK